MPEIKQFPEMRVAFVSNRGPYAEATRSGFEKLFAWLGANNLQPVGRSMAIYHDDPGKVAEAEMRSETCVPIAAEVSGSGDVAVKKIGGFEAATMDYRGAENIQRAYDELYAWIRLQGCREDGSPIETFISQPGEELRAEIAVPIVRVEVESKVSEKKPARGKKAAGRPARKRSTKTKSATKKR